MRQIVRLASDLRVESSLPGVSLWPALTGSPDPERAVFGEYHAAASKAGAFMLRRDAMKLIYHVGMPPQLFDLRNDPDETVDLAATPAGQERVAAMEPSCAGSWIPRRSMPARRQTKAAAPRRMAAQRLS